MSRPIPAFHVTLTDRSGFVVEGTFQWRNRPDAEEYAATMRAQGYTAEITEGPLKTEKVPARSLWDNDRLANGSVLIGHLYFGPTKIRVTGLATADRIRVVRRSYNPDQLVEIEARR